MGEWMDNADIRAYRDILSHSVPFKGLNQALLTHILNVGFILEAKAGDVVFFEKMRGGPGLYVVLSGKVEVFRAPKSRSTKPLRLNTLKPSDCFGEYSLIDRKESSASARALIATKLYFLPHGAFTRLMQQNAETGRTVYHNLLLFLIERLRQKDKVPAKKTARKK